MKTFKEYLGGVRLGNYSRYKPMASLGDHPPKSKAYGRNFQSRGVGLHAGYGGNAGTNIYGKGHMNLIPQASLKAQKRVPRKYKSQDPKQHSDLYTDEDPKDTIKGLGFVDGAKAKESINKIDRSGRPHAHKMQAAMAMHQRARVAADRAKNPDSKKNLHAAEKIYKAYIEKMKKITIKRREGK
tara:strand:+ start:6750 stop:7301 length:552 start_codon:yes stop_codon:yes gene_type:complete